eukprot:Rmarinus@m.23073
MYIAVDMSFDMFVTVRTFITVDVFVLPTCPYTGATLLLEMRPLDRSLGLQFNTHRLTRVGKHMRYRHIVNWVKPGGPAQLAGFEPGVEILRVGAESVVSCNSTFDILSPPVYNTRGAVHTHTHTHSLSLCLSHTHTHTQTNKTKQNKNK